MPSLFSNISRAFRFLWAALFAPTTADATYRRWTDHAVRSARYDFLDAFYQQTLYNGPMGVAVREQFKAYRHIRPLYNSAGRIVDFAANHLMGGQLDPGAGDGRAVPSALPILVGPGGDEVAIRAAVASMWRASNWQVKKSLYTRWGASLGDVGLEVIADEEKGLVRLRVVHPSEVEDVTKDAYGNVRAYTLVRWEVDPEDAKGERMARYREAVTNEAGLVTYSTTRDGEPYAWPGTQGAEWESRFGFVPLVLVQNIDHGGDWGTAETMAALFRSIEMDGQGSNLSDAALKAVNGPWLLTGASLPSPAKGTRAYPDPSYPFHTTGDPSYPGTPNLEINVDESSGFPIVTCNTPDAKMVPLVYPVDVAALDAHIAGIGLGVAEAYPELQVDSSKVGGVISAKALRELKKKASKKVLERRAAYDGGLERALRMGCTMGGVLGFPGFEAFDDGSFARGEMDFHVGSRSVFDADPLDLLEEGQARATVMQTYTLAGLPLSEAMRNAGFAQDEIDRTLAAKEEEAAQQLARIQDAQRAAMSSDIPLVGDQVRIAGLKL
jgi:hypothetical protein